LRGVIVRYLLCTYSVEYLGSVGVRDTLPTYDLIIPHFLEFQQPELHGGDVGYRSKFLNYTALSWPFVSLRLMQFNVRCISLSRDAGSLIFLLLSELPQQSVSVLTTLMPSSNPVLREGPIQNSSLGQEVQVWSYTPQQDGVEMVG